MGNTWMISNHQGLMKISQPLAGLECGNTHLYTPLLPLSHCLLKDGKAKAPREKHFEHWLEQFGYVMLCCEELFKFILEGKGKRPWCGLEWKTWPWFTGTVKGPLEALCEVWWVGVHLVQRLGRCGIGVRQTWDGCRVGGLEGTDVELVWGGLLPCYLGEPGAAATTEFCIQDCSDAVQVMLWEWDEPPAMPWGWNGSVSNSSPVSSLPQDSQTLLQSITHTKPTTEAPPTT